MKLIAFFGRLQCRKTPHNFEMWIMPIHFLFTSFLHGGVVPNSPSLSTDLDASERIYEYTRNYLFKLRLKLYLSEFDPSTQNKAVLQMTT